MESTTFYIKKNNQALVTQKLKKKIKVIKKMKTIVSHVQKYKIKRKQNTKKIPS